MTDLSVCFSGQNNINNFSHETKITKIMSKDSDFVPLTSLVLGKTLVSEQCRSDGCYCLVLDCLLYYLLIVHFLLVLLVHCYWLSIVLFINCPFWYLSMRTLVRYFYCLLIVILLFKFWSCVHRTTFPDFYLD